MSACRCLYAAVTVLLSVCYYLYDHVCILQSLRRCPHVTVSTSLSACHSLYVAVCMFLSALNDVDIAAIFLDRYIISVGWDRRINIYHDPVSESSVHYIQHPLLHWADDEVCRVNHYRDFFSFFSIRK